MPVRSLQALACCNRSLSSLLLRSRTAEQLWQRHCTSLWGSEHWQRVPVSSWRYTYLVARDWAFSARYATQVTLSSQGRVATRPAHAVGQ